MAVIQRFAWVFGVAGLLALIAGGSAAWAYGGLDGRPTQVLITGALLLLIYAGLDRENVEGTVSSRNFIHSGSSLILILLATAAGVAVVALADRYDKTWDLTRERSFTLSEHTIGTLGSLQEDVRVLGFFRGDAQEGRDFRGLMERMQEHTPHLKVEWVDPLRKPRMAEQFDITSEQGTVVLQTADERTQRLDADLSEETVIQRLVLLQSRTEHRICWALGHGEPDPDDEYSERGLGVAVIELEELNYQVTRQMIPTTGVDPDCGALVLARPMLEWTDSEKEALAGYLGAGGRVLLLHEPDGSPDLSEELARYSVKLRPDVVLDLNPENQLMGVDDPAFVVLHGQNLLSHPITGSLAAAVVLPIARSVQAGDVEGISAQPVMETSSDAWGETGTDDPQAMPQPDPMSELVGEVPVMVVAEIEDPGVLEVDLEGFVATPGGRLVVIGDADFAANSYIGLGNNRDLFLNSIAWLVEEEEQIGERPDASESLAIDDLSAAVLCLVSVLFVPGGVAMLALIAWARRRRL